MPLALQLRPEQAPTRPPARRYLTPAGFPWRLHCWAWPAGAGEGSGWPAVASQVSTNGIELLLPDPFRPGTALVVTPLGRDNRSSVVVHVVWQRPRGFAWGHVCGFPRVLDTDELVGWLE
jgi:hypothetical protein